MAKRRPIDEAALRGLHAVASPPREAHREAPTPVIEYLTVREYWSLLFFVWRRDGAEWLRDNLFFTLLLAIGRLAVQFVYGLLHRGDFVSSARPILIAYGVALSIYVVAQLITIPLITIPRLVHNILQRDRERDYEDLTQYFEPIVDRLSIENAELHAQLESPRIVPEIVDYTIQQLDHNLGAMIVFFECDVLMVRRLERFLGFLFEPVLNQRVG
jgi:hypothetical protein